MSHKRSTSVNMSGSKDKSKTPIDKITDASNCHDTNARVGVMTTSTGVAVKSDLDSLKAGVSGPALMEDFLFLDKLQHFDRERIPERVVHARGVGAHGYFECTASAADVTMASLFSKVGKRTPVFARFSTVAGFRGSTDLARDVRGFSVKYYTDEGNWDLVGNNIPVFFIQDAIRFPDLIHAVKPEPPTEVPQAASAHDTFWDFVSLSPESAHMLMWVMSDRALPRTLDQMEGFGVHTFRFVTSEKESCYVRFTYKPVKGVHCAVWDEAQAISGQNSDFHRVSLYESINRGEPLEWVLYAQIVPEMPVEEMIRRFGFDLNDSTKLLPEEVVPLRELGRLVLNKNTENFFAETEQAAFHPGNLVPGIDFSEDPLLQGRVFSYSDTQVYRLGVNRNQLPINAPKCPVYNNMQDGFMQTQIKKQKTLYYPSSEDKEAHSEEKDAHGKKDGDAKPTKNLFSDVKGPTPTDGDYGKNWEVTRGIEKGGCPFLNGFLSGEASNILGKNTKFGHGKTKVRSPTFLDHFSQPRMIYNSMQAWEKAHLISAFSFELNNLSKHHIRERVVNKVLHNIHPELAKRVAERVGVELKPFEFENDAIKGLNLRAPRESVPSISLSNQPLVVKGRKCAILCCDGADGKQIELVKSVFGKIGVQTEVIAPRAGTITTASKGTVKIDKPLTNASPVLYDYCFIVDCGENTEAFTANAFVQEYANSFFNHGKHIADGSENASAFNAVGIQVAPAIGLFGRIGSGTLGGTGPKANSFESCMADMVGAVQKVDRYHDRQLQTRLGMSTEIDV